MELGTQLVVSLVISFLVCVGVYLLTGNVDRAFIAAVGTYLVVLLMLQSRRGR